MTIVDAFFGTQGLKISPDLRTRVEPKLGMSFNEVLTHTTLGPHLEGLTAVRHFNIINDIIDEYYVGWGVVRFENFVLTDIRYH